MNNTINLNNLFHTLISTAMAFLIVGLFVFNFKLIEKFSDMSSILSTKTVQLPIKDDSTDLKEVSFFENLLSPIYTEPKRLVIERLNFDLPVVNVGIDENKVMETPKEWNIVGWYEESARAGENRNVVLNGHYDDDKGKPAAFWQLKNILIGDKVSVYDTEGKKFDYLISKVSYVDPLDIDVIKNTKGKATITLITCSGVWNPSERSYTRRLVIRGELIENLATVNAVEITD